MAEVIPSERELDILKALWELQEGTVREVLDVVSPDGKLAFNTIQTQLRIMEDKGLVTHRAEGRTFIYRPLYSRNAASERFLHKVFDGAVRDLVMTLIKSQDVSSSELQELEKMIAEARKNPPKRGKFRSRKEKS